MGKAVKKDKNLQRRKWAGVEKRKLDKRGAMALNAFSDRGSFAISAQKKERVKAVKKKRNRLLATVLALAMCVSFFPAAYAADDEVQSVTIGVYSTTDMHGKVYSENPVGGTINNSYLKVATAMAQERAAMDGTILIDNGDAIQGTTITSYNVNVEGGANNPVALCLRYCGYDVFVPGNHEFNYTMPVQKNFYDMLAAPADGDVPGTPVTAVCANLLDSETGEVADPYVPYVIKEFKAGEKTFKIAVLGFENMNVPNWDVASHYEGMQFWSDGNTDRSYAWEWENKWKAELEKEKCDIVIVAAHSGEGSADSFNVESQLAYFVANTDGIDMVIAGHNHSVGTSTLQNKNGESVPCVNGGTSRLTKTPITLNSDGTFSFGESTLINLGDNVLTNDEELSALIKPTYDEAVDFVNEPIGTLSGEWDTVSGKTLYSVQGDITDLIHKAQIWAVEQGLARSADAEKYEGETIISITSPVASNGFTMAGLFGEGADTATISLKDCYSLYRYDNNLLYAIEMTGKQLRDWLDYCSNIYRVSGDTISGGGYGTDIAYGINYEVYLGEEEGSRVVNMTWPDGTPVKDDDKFIVGLSSYRLAANADADEFGWYKTTGIDMSQAIWDGTVDAEFGAVGGSIPLIVGEYIKAMCKDGGTITPGAQTHWTIHPGANPGSHQPTEIMVMSTTDMHGKVWDTDVLTDASVNNSLLKVATAVDSIRAEYENTILIDNGDLFQGTTISTYNILSQNGENNPMVLALRNIGYDALVLGNHEFNYSWEVMQSMYGQLKAEDDENGSSVDVLGANLYWRDGDNAGQNAFTPYITKTFQVDGQEFKVGIIGFENTDCDQFDVPANFGVGEDGTGGVTLTPPGNPTRDMALEAEKYVTQLRKPEAEGGEGCDFVIIAYHSGMGSGNTEGDLVIGTNTESQIARMVAGNTGIDLVIAGHDHQSYRTRTTPDKNGNQIPVINGGGGSLARAVVSVSYDAGSGTFTTAVEDLGNQSLSKLENDAELKTLIQPAATAAEGYVNAQYGTAIGTWDGNSSFRLGHNDTIDLVNRSQIWTARQNGVAMDVAATTDIVSNRYSVSAGPISLKDIYRIYRYDNYLYAIEMTGAQLKAWLEGVAAFYSAQVDGDEITYSVQSNFVTALFYGLDFQYDLAKPEGDRVVNLKLSSTGEPITDTQTLIVGVNNYVIGQDPFVKAMGKDASSTEEKAEIIANAVWSSQAALGDEQGLVTQMVANFVKSQTESEAGGVMPAPSGWSLGYNVEVEEEEPDYRPPAVYGGSKLSVGADQVTVTLKKDLTSDQEAQLVRENASKPIVITGDGLSITIPAGTLSSGADINAMIVDPDASGSVIQVTLKNGTTEILPFAVVKNGEVSYVADVEGTYRLFSNSKTFADVGSGYWASDAIDFVTSHEFFNGTGNGVFSPDALMTRSMLVTVLYRIDGEKTAASSGFADVPAGTWYTDAVNWAAAAGIVTGTGTGFDPDGTITREQLCTILIRYMETAGLELDQVADTSGLTDLNTVSSWAGDSVELCVKYGLIFGKPGGLCDPQGTATRAEIAAILARFVQAAV